MFDRVDLCFDIQIIPQQGNTTAKLWVQVYDGSRWVTIKEYDLAQSTNHHKTLDVTSYLSEAFQVRSKVPNAVDSGLLGLDLFYNGYTTINPVERYRREPGRHDHDDLDHLDHEHDAAPRPRRPSPV